MKKLLIIGIGVITALWIIYTILGRQIPIHRSDDQVGSERIYYLETSKMVFCDIAYFEVVVYEDENYQYVYELIDIGNGSCKSDLYIWDDLHYYELSEAIALSIVSIDDFLESDVVIKIPIV